MDHSTGTHYVRGVVVSSPETFKTDWGQRRTIFTLKALEYKRQGRWIKTTGLCKVYINDSEIDYSYGNRLTLLSSLKYLKPSVGGDGFDYADYLRAKSIYTIASVRSDSDVVVHSAEGGSFIKRAILGTRKNIGILIKRYLPPQDAAILSAMLIGKRSDLSTETREIFVKTGTAHILSVSGLHVMVLSGMIFFMLRTLRIPHRVASMLVIGFLFVYTIVAGGRTPIMRAAIMVTVYLIGYALNRDYDIYSALSLAGIIILMANPRELFGAGFVLSFSCVFFICYLTPKLESYLRLSQANKTRRNMVRPVLVSCAVYIGIMPLTAYYFNIISPITIIANLFVVPGMGVILVCGILFVIIASPMPQAGAVMGYLAHFVFLPFVKIVSFFSSIRFGYFYVEKIPIYLIVGYYAMLFLTLNRQRVRLSRQGLFILYLVMLNLVVWKAALI